MRYRTAAAVVDLSLGCERTGEWWLFVDRVEDGEPADNPEQWELDSTDFGTFVDSLVSALSASGAQRPDATEIAQSFAMIVWERVRLRERRPDR